jgi:hypothetical protein
MKSVTRWSPKLKPGKQPGKDDIVECKEELPPDRIGPALAIGSLVFIGVASAALSILWDSPKKTEPLKPDTAELNAHTQQDAVAAESKPTSMDPPVRSTSGYSSLLPTPSLVEKGLPGSPYQEPSPVIKVFQEVLISHL